jgi:hypothetical protein
MSAGARPLSMIPHGSGTGGEHGLGGQGAGDGAGVEAHQAHLT